jgi:hypothetical protein
MADEEVKASVNGEDSSKVITLRKSIIANGDEVNELKFREPTAGDIERVGSNPVNIEQIGESGKLKVTFDSKAMSHMMSILAAVPPSTIRQMHPKDWNTAAWELASFFMPDL